MIIIEAEPPGAFLFERTLLSKSAHRLLHVAGILPAELIKTSIPLVSNKRHFSWCSCHTNLTRKKILSHTLFSFVIFYIVVLLQMRYILLFTPHCMPSIAHDA
jgi:hypothetical protein